MQPAQLSVNSQPPTSRVPLGTAPINQNPQFLTVPGAGVQQSGAVLGQPRPLSGQSPLKNLPGQYVTTTSQVGQAARPGVISQVMGSRIVQGGAIAGQIPVTQPAPTKPKSSSRIQYIPFDKKIVDYETRQIVNTMWVPVQRKCLNYYAIEHITEYLPREVDDVRYEMVPEEHVEYRLQYVPVEKKIVHLPHDENVVRGENYQAYNINRQVVAGIPQGIYGKQQTTVTSAVNVPGYQQLESRAPLPKSNFVTSDGYVPSYLIPNTYQSQPTGSPSFMANQQFMSGITSALKTNMQTQAQSVQAQSQQPGPSFFQDQQFMSGLANNIKPRQSRPMETRISGDSYESGRQTFTDRYAY